MICLLRRLYISSNLRLSLLVRRCWQRMDDYREEGAGEDTDYEDSYEREDIYINKFE